MRSGLTLSPKAGALKRLTAKDFSKKELVDGKLYLAQQWVEQAKVVRDMDLKFKKPVAMKTRDGKASVQLTTSFWSDWNGEAAKAFRPVAPAIRAAKIIPADLRAKLLTRPLDALIDIFNPLFDRVAAPCTRTMNAHLKGGRRVEWFGKYIDIRISQPSIDNKLDASTKNLMRKLRIMQAFIVCFLKKPLEFAGECLKEGVDIVTDVVSSVSDAVGGAVESIAKGASDTAKRASDEAAKAAAGVASFFGGLVGLGGYGLGEAATGISGAIAAAITTIAGVVTENVLLALIGGILGTITTLGVVAMQTGAQEKATQQAIDKGIPVETVVESPDGTKTRITAGAPPTTIAPGQAPAEALADDELGPAGAPPPPSKAELQAEGAEGGFPIVPAALVAGVALFLFLRR